jgi:hypothetical protein
LAGAGCLAHIACAFHFYHGWSHAEAYRHVARRTYEVIGWDWGGGIYFNYAFALLWLADAAWWWLAPGKYLLRSRAVNLAIHLSVFFIVFNATVVFGSGWIRWSGAGGTLFLAVLIGWATLWSEKSLRQSDEPLAPRRVIP